jgi:2-hydroxychromene-2-carboxylate isomerase
LWTVVLRLPQVLAQPDVQAAVGDVISLADARVARAQGHGLSAPGGGGRAPRITFYFDLSSPFTYLAAERVDRLFGNLVWRPVLEEVLQASAPPPEVAEERAHALGLPLVWPELGPASVRPAMRIASLAAEQSRAAPFVLAASRLAFCGGFELDHPEVLAEAAAAANLGLEECLHAAGDVARDGAMEAGARKLLAHGADRLPAVRVGRLLFAGEDRVAEAAAAASIPAAMRAV